MPRPRLRTLMLWVVLVSAFLAWHINEISSLAGLLFWAIHSHWAWLFALALGWSTARWLRLTAWGPRLRLAVAIPAGASLLALAMLVWSYERTVRFADLDPSLGFPYPDAYLVRVERDLDRQYPVTTPGSVKMHGEFPRLMLDLGLTILCASPIVGLLTAIALGPTAGTALGLPRRVVSQWWKKCSHGSRKAGPQRIPE